MKNFQTHNQLLNHLRNKNLSFQNSSKVKRILEREGYYSVVLGYRNFFSSSTSPFRFQQGTTFNNVYELYKLDRELRMLFLKELLKIEKMMGSLISYYFSEKHKKNNTAYLHFSNYDPSKNVHDVINKIVRRIKDKGVTKHYVDSHKEVPLWVLINTMTFGEISYMYAALQKPIRISIAKHISKIQGIALNHIIIAKDFKAMTKFRNVCAHDERFFCYTTSHINKLNNLMEKIKQYIPISEYRIFEKNVATVMKKHKKGIGAQGVLAFQRESGLTFL